MRSVRQQKKTFAAAVPSPPRIREIIIAPAVLAEIAVQDLRKRKCVRDSSVRCKEWLPFLSDDQLAGGEKRQQERTAVTAMRMALGIARLSAMGSITCACESTICGEEKHRASQKNTSGKRERRRGPTGTPMANTTVIPVRNLLTSIQLRREWLIVSGPGPLPDRPSALSVGRVCALVPSVFSCCAEE